MSYEPKTWVAREKVTSAGLNHIEQGITDVESGVFAFFAIPVITNSVLVNYELSCSYSELDEAVQDGKALQCLIKNGGKYIQTLVEMFRDKLDSYYVQVSTIGKTIDDCQFYPFVIYPKSELISVSTGESVYIIPTNYGLDDFRVPMLGGADNFLSFNPINEVFDVETLLEQIVMGAYSAAISAGGATLSTFITDSTMVEQSDYMVGKVERNIRYGRGTVLQATIYNVSYYLPLECVLSYSAKKVITFSINLSDIIIDQGALLSSTSYDGTVSLAVGYSQDEPQYAVITVHLDKHDATIV